LAKSLASDNAMIDASFVCPRNGAAMCFVIDAEILGQEWNGHIFISQLASIIAAPHNPPSSGGLCGGGANPHRLGFSFKTATRPTLAGRPFRLSPSGVATLLGGCFVVNPNVNWIIHHEYQGVMQNNMRE